MAGLSVTEYWSMVPSHVERLILAKNERLADEARNTMRAAYYTAALGRAKKMPSLDNFLGRKKAQSGAEQLAIMKNFMVQQNARVAKNGL